MKQRYVLSVTILTIFFCFSITYSQEYKWQKIVPTQSKINDVESILGKNKIVNHSIFYELEDGEYYVKYSDGKCTTKWREEWNTPELPALREGTPLIDWDVPEWTVVKVTFSPKEDIPISSLGLNLKKLKKVRESEGTDIFNYVDIQTGISYGIDFNDRLNTKVVTFITIEPSSKHKNLLCKKNL